jgi:hypothetical protein
MRRAVSAAAARLAAVTGDHYVSLRHFSARESVQ